VVSLKSSSSGKRDRRIKEEETRVILRNLKLGAYKNVRGWNMLEAQIYILKHFKTEQIGEGGVVS